jgi:hypothetical protein
MIMQTRREFLGVTAKGATMTAATGLLAKAAFATGTGNNASEQVSDSEGNGHYRPSFKFGMGQSAL